eukprot:scaffold35757_cov52-Phaeocystis_antarctica.AAC.1
MHAESSSVANLVRVRVGVRVRIGVRLRFRVRVRVRLRLRLRVSRARSRTVSAWRSTAAAVRRDPPAGRAATRAAARRSCATPRPARCRGRSPRGSRAGRAR